ncbi:transposase, Ptta/En/Spm, plant [Spatholobus suberectus]|nr:transposase, Ptta/En/Spm, plant [Spatholobus suberectus]
MPRTRGASGIIKNQRGNFQQNKVMPGHLATMVELTRHSTSIAQITWAPHHEQDIKNVYDKNVKKYLHDMLTKAKDKGTRPHWIGEDAWVGLLNYWESKEFKDKSIQKKNNQASSRGALHTIGCKSHLDVALGLVRKYGRPLDPDQLFLATHTKKNGSWVDDRARNTKVIISVYGKLNCKDLKVLLPTHK